MFDKEELTEEQICWAWLADHENVASASSDFHVFRVTWYVDGFGRCETKAPTLLAAVKSAMTTTFTATEYFPGKEK